MSFVVSRGAWPGAVVFFSWSGSKSIDDIDHVGLVLKDDHDGTIQTVEGNTDNRGTEEYNRALGERRALSVREELVKMGMNPEMVPTISYGEDKPADPANNEAAWAKNRRAEFVIAK